MKKSSNLIKPLAMVSIVALSIFSCARTDSGRVTTNTGNEPMGETTTGTETTTDRTTTGTETTPTDRTTTGTQTEGTATGTETMGETGTTTDTETMGGTTTTGTQTQGQTGGMDQDRESLSNPVSYDDMFENVENTEDHDILALARMDENLSTFVELVEQTGLAESFNHAEPITLFAPTNEAFQSLSQERYEYLINPDNRDELIRVLQAHIIPSEVSSAAFADNQRIVDGEGNEIPVDTEMHGTQVFIGGAEIVRSDIAASNGIIHVVNGVIDPQGTPAGMGPHD